MQSVEISLEEEESRWREPDQGVIQFAELLDDRGLLRRAMRSGLRTLRSPDLLLMLWRRGSLEAEQYRLLLLQLEAEERIDRATMQSYLELGGEK